MVAVPLGSLVVAHIAIAILLVATGHPPVATFRRLFDAAYIADGALTNSLIAATPLAFTGLAAAVAFRMKLFNIGAEGQLYFGAIGASGIAHSARGPVDAGPDRRDDRRWRSARGGVGCHPRAPARVPPHERDHHLADAQLRRGARPQLPHLRLALLLARHVGDGPRVPPGEGARRRGDLARDDDRVGRDPLRLPRRRRRRVRRLGALHAHALRLRGAGDRRLPARRALRGHADEAQDRGDHVPLRCDRRDRRSEPDGRLPPRARRAWAAAGELRLHGHRRRGARPLQPVRRRASPRSSSAGSRTPATRSRAPSSHRGSSA